MPDNIGNNEKYCSPWKLKILTYDSKNYSILGKETTITQIECAFGVIEPIKI